VESGQRFSCRKQLGRNGVKTIRNRLQLKKIFSLKIELITMGGPVPMQFSPTAFLRKKTTARQTPKAPANNPPSDG
jgi:hypothetical protein